jgi:hypothetical protein
VTNGQLEASPGGRRRSGATLFSRRLGALALVAILLPSAGIGVVSLAGAASPHAVAGALLPAIHTPVAKAVEIPASNTSVCYDLNNTTCVQAAPGSPNIIPSPGNRTSATLPNTSQSIVITIRSTWRIVPLGVAVNTSGPRAPIALNVSGVLWNGDPWYSVYDDSVWHSRSATDPFWETSNQTGNKTWPYTYAVTFYNKTTAQQPIFYAGMTITWWIYLVTRSVGNIYKGWVSPSFTYTYAGAWPASPYPSAAQYGGPNAALTDLAVHQTPLQANWNDTVHVSIAATGADSLTYATIGQATLFVEERRADGSPYQNGSFAYPITVTNDVGVVKAQVAIPGTYSQIVGLNVTYWIVAYDTAQNEIDMITTPAFSYTVHGNGSFQTGDFSNDLLLTTAPYYVAQGTASNVPQVAAGQNVSVQIESKSASASILTAVLEYTFTYNATGAVAHGQESFARNNSTTMYTVLPGFPISSEVNFTVLAWDYTMLLDISQQYSFTTPAFNSFVPTNLTFFTVLVYDNGSSSWVTGATVQIRDPSGFVNSVGTTYFGVAYPNETLSRWTPLLVPANVTYNVSVFDRGFLPAGTTSATPVSIQVRATNPMNFIGTLVQTSYYEIVQEGSAIFFYLNTTAIGPQYSPSNPTSVPLSSVLGLLGASAAAVLVLDWWLRIQARRKAEEKRITL